MGSRLHPAAILVYAVQALREGALPLVVVLGVSVFGGGFDADAAWRALGLGILGVGGATLVGAVRWATTSYSFAGEAIRLRTGMLSTNEVEVPFARVQALDVEQGPIQRLFGVQAVHVQTAGGGKGGEIVLGALDALEIAYLRNLLAGRRPELLAEQPDAPERRLSRPMLLLAAVTSGQLGVILPLLAGASQMVDDLFDDPVEGEQAVAGALPDSAGEWALAIGGLLAIAWLLATAGSIVAFAGFRVRREGANLRLRRGFLARREATIGVARIRAVRVVEGLLRQPFGLAAVRVEIVGYAKEPAAAQTLFPLLRLRDVPAFLAELVPELADDLGGLAPPPPRALRRYLLPPAVAGLLVGAAAGLALGAWWPLAAALPGLGYGWLAWRAAGWRLRDGRLAVRARTLARTTVLAPAANRESHDLAQTVLQRRGRLADVSVAFGRRTSARIRHLDLDTALDLWVRIGPRWGAPPDVGGPGRP
jgi:putative membrane protein